MTTTTATGRERTGAPDTAEPRPRFRDLVAAEWIKLRSLRSTWIAYGATAVAVIAFNAGTAYDTYTHWTAQDTAKRAQFVRDGTPLMEAFTVNAAMIMALALAALGALVIVCEYGTGTIRTTFAAVPDRHAVVAAKAVVVAAVTTAFGALVAAASFAFTQAILDRRDAGVSIGEPGALRVVVASTLLAPVCALAGLALGALIRGTAATMIASVVVVVVLPLVFTEGRRWSAIVDHAMPVPAWIRLTAVGRPSTAHPWSVEGAWTVYAAWALVAVGLAVAGVGRRDQ